MEALGEDVQNALNKPNPNIKLQTNLFLYRELTKCNAQNAPKKLLKTLLPILIKVPCCDRLLQSLFSKSLAVLFLMDLWKRSILLTFYIITFHFFQLTGDSDPEVREASYSAIGAAMKAIGEKACMVLLTEIAEDKTKMTKVLSICVTYKYCYIYVINCVT